MEQIESKSKTEGWSNFDVLQQVKKSSTIDLFRMARHLNEAYFCCSSDEKRLACLQRLRVYTDEIILRLVVGDM